MKYQRKFKKWLHEGMEVEREHTKNKRIQRKIALDHLREHPLYYRELEKMEKRLKKIPKYTRRTKRSIHKRYY